MNRKQKLQELKNYFEVARQVGHTTAMLNGVKNTGDCIVLTHNQDMGKLIENELLKDNYPNVKTISYGGLNHATLRGYGKPMLIDNATIYQILYDALYEIQLQEARVEEVKDLARQILEV